MSKLETASNPSVNTLGRTKNWFAEAEACLDALKVESALRFFQEAEAGGHDPDACAAGRWTCFMLMGDFESAWRQSEQIEQRGRPDIHRFWNGESIDGKHLLVRCLHGLGDTLQFIRYAPLIRARTKSLTIEAQPILKQLIAFSNLADHVITWGEPEPYWDQQIEIIELPRIFRTTVDTIPGTVPYLSCPPSPANIIGSERDLLRIGLVWAASSYNPARSIPLNELASALALPGVQLYSLQAGSDRAQIEGCDHQIINLCQEGDSMIPVAQSIESLDLIVSVDTMMAHLAGAMGRRVWTLLPLPCDWRWMMERADSPWYPTMRLFRQCQRNEWHSVLQEVRTALQTLLDAQFAGLAPSYANAVDIPDSRLPLG